VRLSPENQHWLDDFRQRHGRSPRILHIGNIANNAYNNARLLNEVGLDCDVICYDYYHVMGCPEWEDADISGEFGEQFRPQWRNCSLGGFQRPQWFVQGPLADCIDYLIARSHGHQKHADQLWSNLEALNGTQRPRTYSFGGGIVSLANRAKGKIECVFPKILSVLTYFLIGGAVSSRIASACDKGSIATLSRSEIARMLFAWMLLGFALCARTIGAPVAWLMRRDSDFNTQVACLMRQFDESFPARSDALAANDVEMYRQVSEQWRRLFRNYDLIQAYATDPILPMVAGKRPYIGFEHGTLRSHTLCDEPICRLTSLAYHLADRVFITNGDCIDYARKIGVTRFTPMLHPVDERRIAAIAGTDLRHELRVKHLFLCTLRHDWAIKGTDQYIRALPDLVKALGRDFRVIMTRWGAELERSMALAESLGVGDLIVWSEPLPRRKLIQTLKSVDVLFDQLTLPHFGATAPEGIAAGVPVIMSYDPASTEWLVAEPAPILSARTSTEIVERVLQALDAGWLTDYRRRASTWFDAHHSSRLVVQGHLDAYRKLIPAH